MTRFARELSEAIKAAVAHDPGVEECRRRARAAGYDLRLSLEAIIGFASRSDSQALVRLGPSATEPSAKPLAMSANDRRFLRSLRIAVDDTTPKAVE